MREKIRSVADSLGWKRRQRRRDDFEQTFSTPHGERVLMFLYRRLYGKQSIWPASGNSHELAMNEGMRFAWNIIAEELRHEDMELRRMCEDQINEDRREELNQ